METWKKPTITAPGWAWDMQEQPHVLIAGTTGAGKSTALNTFLVSLLHNAPTETRLILIDPKGVELLDYAPLPHTIVHARTIPAINSAITQAAAIMDARFLQMQSTGMKRYPGPDIYLIIDEYVDIKLLAGPGAEKQLIRIAAKGRAAKIHIILCTQRPTRDIINGAIKANFPAVLALRTHDKQESRNLIGTSGCEMLPRYGVAYYDTPTETELIQVNIPMIPEAVTRQIIAGWMAQA